MEGKRSQSRSRSNQKEKSRNDRSRDPMNDGNRWQRGRDNYNKPRSNNYNNRHQNNRNDRNHSYDRNDRNQSYNRNNNHNRNRQEKKQVRAVFKGEIDPPKSFVLADSTAQGTFKVKLEWTQTYPNRVEPSNLGQLKNKITPIQKLWGSHIKQYLNISQFVQIFRPHKSLAYGNIQYGKTMIKYQDDFNCIVYDNQSQQSQIFSRAYFKLWEILETGVMDEMKSQDLSIGCVAEGPGGFIHAIFDYRLKQQKGELKNKRDHYNAITLKIDNNTRNAKDWTDKRGKNLFSRLRQIGPTKINLSYGKTGTGDLLLTQNIEHFSQEVTTKCQLVTGDGGIECIGDKQFEYQEVFNVKLFFGEIITALHIQQKNGKFILKIYDCGFQLTRQLIILLTLYYNKVQIIKPITSRPGNSQKYLLCQKFRGISEQQLGQLKQLLRQWTAVQPQLSYFQNNKFVHNLFDFTHLPQYSTVYNNIKEANDWFVNEQMQKIEEGLQLNQKHRESARSIEEELRKTRWAEQMCFAYEWCRRYGLPTIAVELANPQDVMA